MGNEDRFGDSGGFTIRSPSGKKIAQTKSEPIKNPPTQQDFDGDKELDRILKKARDARKS